MKSAIKKLLEFLQSDGGILSSKRLAFLFTTFSSVTSGIGYVYILIQRGAFQESVALLIALFIFACLLGGIVSAENIVYLITEMKKSKWSKK